MSERSDLDAVRAKQVKERYYGQPTHIRAFTEGWDACLSHLQAQAGEIPECPKYVAHPQAVWFYEHWRPIIDQCAARIALAEARCRELEAELDSLTDLIPPIDGSSE
jgi:hypothetical protein